MPCFFAQPLSTNLFASCQPQSPQKDPLFTNQSFPVAHYPRLSRGQATIHPESIANIPGSWEEERMNIPILRGEPVEKLLAEEEYLFRKYDMPCHIWLVILI